jgi:hypothetical protein
LIIWKRVFENKEQIEISKFMSVCQETKYVGIGKFVEDKIYYRLPERPTGR